MRNTSLVILVGIALLVVGCGDPHEKLADKMIDNMEEITQVLKDVKDAAGAKAAAEKFEKLVKKQEEIVAEMQKLPEPKPEVKKKVDEMMDVRGKKAFGELVQEIMRVSELSPEAAQAFQRGVPMR